jgi:hypothetical protein
MLIQINDESGSIARRLRDWRRTMTSAMAIATAIAAMVLGAGCGGPSSPSPAIPTVPPAPASGTPAAVLEISTFELVLYSDEDGHRWYEPRIVLTEKSGTSAALLQQLAFVEPGRDTEIFRADGCLFGDSRRVPAGGTWKQSQAYYYCLPAYDESIVGSTVVLTVAFTDENGVGGRVTGSATALPPGVWSLDRR